MSQSIKHTCCRISHNNATVHSNVGLVVNVLYVSVI